jgi:DeoR/GlpR family transcriptional regulator of sugar metabolism
MDLSHRQQALLDHLARLGECAYGDLAGRLRVSSMTVRREVDRLAAGGLLIKALRGARRAESGPALLETDLQARLTANLAEKRAIAVAAARTVRPGQTLFLDGSTTCLELAKELGQHAEGLTVVTSSVLVCLHLGRGGANTVLCLGGHYDPTSASLYGPETEAALERLYPDIAFLSTKGFIPAEGTFESASHLFRLKQIVARQAQQVTLLVDHSKYDQRALAQVLNAAQIQRVISDAKAPTAAVALLRKSGCEVVLAAGRGPRLTAAPPARKTTRRRPGGPALKPARP